MATPYVYCIRNKITDEVYYGYRSANKVSGVNDLGKVYFTSSVKIKDNFENFEIVFIRDCQTAEEAFLLEQSYIEENWENPLLLNENYHKSGSKVFRNTVESHKRQAEKIKGRKQTEEHIKKRFDSFFKKRGGKKPKPVSKGRPDLSGKNNPNFGNKWTEEQKIAASKNKKGICTITSEGRKKISEANKGKPEKANHLNNTRKHCNICGFESTLGAFNRYHKVCPQQ